MEQFIVSARKYRPANFDSLIGQENIAVTLKNSIIRGQLAHAYLFCGPRGVGKTSAARIFAKSINCLHPSENMEPCGECESCRSFNEGRSFCIHELDAASNNSVDDIRNLTDMVRIPPQIGKYSVYIIDEVHMLSAAAFNAFLKTLEEPPAYAIFILATTEKHKILPTILSRCQTYDFNRISIEGIVQNLRKIASAENISIGDDAMHIIAQKADGAMRDALTLFDQTVAFCGKDIKYEEVIRNLNVLDYEYYFRLCDAFLKKDHIQALLIFDEVLSKGFNALHFISGLNSHFRDLVVCKNKASRSLMSLPPSLVSRYEQLASLMSVAYLFKAIEICTGCEAQYRQSGNQRLLIEFSLMKLCFIEGIPSSGTETVRNVQSAEAGTPAVLPQATETAQETVARSGQSAAEEEKPAEEEKTAPAAEAAKPVAAAEPASVPVPESRPADTPARPHAGGLSLKEMMKRAQSVAAGQDDTAVAVTEDIPFDLEKARKVWAEMAEEESVRYKSMATAMEQYPLELRDTTLVFHVSNEAQKTWIENKCLNRLILTLRTKLSNRNAGLVIEIMDTPQTEKTADRLYMHSQKAHYLEHKNENLKEFVKTLELDTK